MSVFDIFQRRNTLPADSRNELQSLTVKLPKADGKERLVGLHSGNAFILYQPQNDTLALHEWLGLNLTRSTGRFAAQQQFVEVRAVIRGGCLDYRLGTGVSQ